MGRLLTALLSSCTILWPSLSGAADGIDASADVLAIASNGTTSFLNNGLGALRFDSDHQGLQLDDLRVGFRGSTAEIVHVTVEAVSYGDRDSNPIDLTEAFVEVRPFPHGPWRSRLKIGAFYAPISLENRLTGWRSAYSLAPSAINTWVGEELRTFGAEYDLDWLGRQRGHDWDLSLVGSVYGWNESAGQLMSERGWAIHDRQSTLFGKYGTAEPGRSLDERLLTTEGANGPATTSTARPSIWTRWRCARCITTTEPIRMPSRIRPTTTPGSRSSTAPGSDGRQRLTGP